MAVFDTFFHFCVAIVLISYGLLCLGNTIEKEQPSYGDINDEGLFNIESNNAKDSILTEDSWDYNVVSSEKPGPIKVVLYTSTYGTRINDEDSENLHAKIEEDVSMFQYFGNQVCVKSLLNYDSTINCMPSGTDLEPSFDFTEVSRRTYVEFWRQPYKAATVHPKFFADDSKQTKTTMEHFKE